MNIFLFLLISFPVAVYSLPNHGIVKRSSVYTCRTLSETLMNAVFELERDKPETIESFQEACSQLKTCFEELGSPKNNAMIREGIKKTETVCITSGFLYGPFNNCAKKLISNNTKCFQGWTPLKDVNDKSIFSDPVRYAALKKDLCDNVFGNDKCMRKEIIDTCGMEAWAGAKKHVPALVRVTAPQCEIGVL